MSYEQLKLENQLCFPFYAVSRLIIRAYQSDLDKIGITYPQYLTLMILWEKDSVTVNDIADKLILNTNTITPLLKRMEAMELIKREQSKIDQRKVIISLTEKGNNLQHEASQIPLNLMTKLGINPAEVNLEEINKIKLQLNDLIALLKNKNV
ncbi:MAG: MarR family winged helix-turn-helix transcriptional regulator [Paludibacter sp.]